MIVDSSAIVEILLHQGQESACLEALQHAPVVRLSAANLLEVSIVLERKGGVVSETDLDLFLSTMAISIEPVTESLANLARVAHRLYGRGNDSKAKLNFGDCFAYALAREKNEPLLYVGDDFSHTDITPALAR